MNRFQYFICLLKRLVHVGFNHDQHDLATNVPLSFVCAFVKSQKVLLNNLFQSKQWRMYSMQRIQICFCWVLPLHSQSIQKRHAYTYMIDTEWSGVKFQSSLIFKVYKDLMNEHFWIVFSSTSLIYQFSIMPLNFWWEMKCDHFSCSFFLSSRMHKALQ